jgi:hypothetical protein
VTSPGGLAAINPQRGCSVLVLGGGAATKVALSEQLKIVFVDTWK